MIASIVIGGPDSRERATREPCILSRLMLAAQHSRHAGRNSAVFRCGVLARVRGLPGIASRNTGRQASFNSFPIFRGVGSLIPGLRRALKPVKQPAHRLADRLQVSILSAPIRGLAGFIDGHDETRRKLGNVRKHSGEIRNECG